MKDESIILLVFEGKKAEVKIYENLKSHFSRFGANTNIYATFDTHIYELYWVLQKDSDQDIVELIRDRNDQNRQLLANISRDSVAEVYLYFARSRMRKNIDIIYKF